MYTGFLPQWVQYHNQQWEWIQLWFPFRPTLIMRSDIYTYVDAITLLKVCDIYTTHNDIVKFLKVWIIYLYCHILVCEHMKHIKHLPSKRANLTNFPKGIGTDLFLAHICSEFCSSVCPSVNVGGLFQNWSGNLSPLEYHSLMNRLRHTYLPAEVHVEGYIP